MQLDVEDNIARCSTGRGELEISLLRLLFPFATAWPTLFAKVGKVCTHPGNTAGFDPMLPFGS
jgi:hypothetical protein